MPLNVVFPPGIDDPVPTIGPEPPGPWRPSPPFDPSQMCNPPPEWEPEPPLVCEEPPPGFELPPPLPVSVMPPPTLGVDLTGLDDTAPPIGPLPAPDPWGGMWNP
jgi:hypothetical protein